MDRAITTSRRFRLPAFGLAALWLVTGSAFSDTESGVETAVALATPAIEFEALEPLAIHPHTSASIVEHMRQYHYVRKNLDDALSSSIFDKYLSSLDPSRAYFLASDVQAIEKYRYKLDEALKQGEMEPAFDIYNRYQESAISRIEYLIDLLTSEFEFDFTIDESVEIDRSDAPWPSSVADMNDLWRKRLKATALNMRLSGKDDAEIRELLVKRYKNRLRQTQQIRSEDAFQLYVNAFAATYDPHTQYFSPRNSENFNMEMSLSLEGIGAVLRSEDEYTSVVRIVAAGPADKTGALHASDKIISVGQGRRGSLIDVVGMRLDDVVQMIRGPKGSRVRLEVIPNDSPDGTSKIIEIVREKVKLEEQSAQKKILTLNEGGQTRRLGVIEIPTFYLDFQASQRGDPNYRSTTRDVRKLLEELRGEDVDGLIIDLRNNGGGSLMEADALTGLFIDSGPTVQVKTARRNPQVYSDTDDQTAWDGPLAVLVNRLSASASEIFAGAIQDYGRGVVIGNQTFGKGTVQQLIPLGRGQLKLTQAKFYRVSGQSTQHQGVVPDISFPSVMDPDRVGESSLDDALGWDQIQPAIYRGSNEISLHVGALKRRHDERVADDPEFDYLRSLSDRAKENAERTHLSLLESERVKQKEEDDAWRLSIENDLLASRGEELVESIEELNDRIEAQIEAEEESKDAVLEEAGNILADLIGMTTQLAMVETVPTTTTLDP